MHTSKKNSRNSSRQLPGKTRSLKGRPRPQCWRIVLTRPIVLIAPLLLCSLRASLAENNVQDKFMVRVTESSDSDMTIHSHSSKNSSKRYSSSSPRSPGKTRSWMGKSSRSMPSSCSIFHIRAMISLHKYVHAWLVTIIFLGQSPCFA